MNKTSRRWVVIYTRPKWEKKISQLLTQQGITVYCPLIKTRRQWSDRIKTVELPLFPSYVFVYIDIKEELEVLKTIGVLHFVKHNGRIAIVQAQEIGRIEELLLQKLDELETVPIDQLNIGDRIKVKTGLLNDWQGEVITVKGKSVVMVLEQFNCALIAKVNISQHLLLPV